MKATPIALCLIIAALGGCGQKGPLFLSGEAPASQTDDAFGVDRSGGALDGNNDTGDAASSPVPAGNPTNDVSPDNSPYPDRPASARGTP